ncbi:galactose-specific lectin nattectin-like [Protopterus annectens]|uniref:galactose-specific lectin nattectin-like n=1 Tax=Protopterus annectens TaxID=7888 RepID=UPI001CFBFE2F|nr:galactose-specific lectin nattectin-like [Protopterus annectens]
MKTVLVFIALLVAVQSNKLVPKTVAKVKDECSQTIVVGKGTYTFYKCPKDYYAAVEICKSEHVKGNLLSIHTHELHVNIINELKQLNNIEHEVWIGATKGRFSTTFYWTDGSKMNYKYWARGSPSKNLQSWFSPACVVMETKEPGYWHDVDCYKLRPFVCETE